MMDHSNHSAEVERLQVALELARTFMEHDPMTAWHRLSAVQQDVRATIDRFGPKDAELLQMEAYVSELVERAWLASARFQRASERRESHMRERERAYITA